MRNSKIDETGGVLSQWSPLHESFPNASLISAPHNGMELLRQGEDLVVRMPHGDQWVAQDYFAKATLSPLHLPDGTTISAGQMEYWMAEQTASSPNEGAETEVVVPSSPAVIGKVAGLSGRAGAKMPGNKIRILKDGDPIHEGEILKTGKNGRIRVVFRDDSEFQLAESSIATITRYLYEPEQHQGWFSAKISVGLFRYMSGKLADFKKENEAHSEIHTPTAVVGIRGSELRGEVTPDGVTTVVHSSGVLDISDKQGNGVVTLLEPGTATVVTIGGAPPVPVFKAPQDMMKRFDEYLSPGSINTRQEVNEDKGKGEGADNNSTAAAKTSDNRPTEKKSEKGQEASGKPSDGDGEADSTDGETSSSEDAQSQEEVSSAEAAIPGEKPPLSPETAPLQNAQSLVVTPIDAMIGLGSSLNFVNLDGQGGAQQAAVNSSPSASLPVQTNVIPVPAPTTLQPIFSPSSSSTSSSVVSSGMPAWNGDIDRSNSIHLVLTSDHQYFTPGNPLTIAYRDSGDLPTIYVTNENGAPPDYDFALQFMTPEGVAWRVDDIPAGTQDIVLGKVPAGAKEELVFDPSSSSGSYNVAVYEKSPISWNPFGDAYNTDLIFWNVSNGGGIPGETITIELNEMSKAEENGFVAAVFGVEDDVSALIYPYSGADHAELTMAIPKHIAQQNWEGFLVYLVDSNGDGDLSSPPDYLLEAEFDKNDAVSYGNQISLGIWTGSVSGAIRFEDQAGNAIATPADTVIELDLGPDGNTEVLAEVAADGSFTAEVAMFLKSGASAPDLSLLTWGFSVRRDVDHDGWSVKDYNYYGTNDVISGLGTLASPLVTLKQVSINRTINGIEPGEKWIYLPTGQVLTQQDNVLSGTVYTNSRSSGWWDSNIFLDRNDNGVRDANEGSLFISPNDSYPYAINQYLLYFRHEDEGSMHEGIFIPDGYTSTWYGGDNAENVAVGSYYISNGSYQPPSVAFYYLDANDNNTLDQGEYAYVMNLSNWTGRAYDYPDLIRFSEMTPWEGLPVLSFSDVTVSEDTGTGYVTLTLSRPVEWRVTGGVSLVTSGDFGASANWEDLSLPSDALSLLSYAYMFAPGETSTTIAINIKNDMTAEANEFAYLDNSWFISGATLGDSRSVVTILDDDAPPEIYFGSKYNDNAGGLIVNEQDTLWVKVFLTHESSSAITFDYTIQAGTATQDKDYSLPNSATESVTIPAGSLTDSFYIYTLNDPSIEEDETFTITFSNPVNATLSKSSLVVTILDDDSQVTVAPYQVQLATLDGANGFSTTAVGAPQVKVSNVGDVNGDGLDDVILSRSYGGGDQIAYLLFGSTTGFASELDLATLDGSNGVILEKSRTITDNYSDINVGGAGDFNGDGFDDLIVGIPLAEGEAVSSGVSYVIFGGETLSSHIDLDSLNGSNGFQLKGASIDEWSGSLVQGAGDFNDDGFGDLIIAAQQPMSGGVAKAYLVFGGESVSASMNLSELDGSNGFAIQGDGGSSDLTVNSVAGLGDFNGDGFDDVVLGMSQASGDTNGAVYVLFGASSGFTDTLDLTNLLTGQGFRIIEDRSQAPSIGFSVAGAGDVNGDDYDDLVVGTSDGSGDWGGAYVIFGAYKGGSNGSSDDRNIDDLIKYSYKGYFLSGDRGAWVSGAGDVNGDGLDDLILGDAPGSLASGTLDKSLGYVVYGVDENTRTTIDLQQLQPMDGFQIQMTNAQGLGLAVSGAGDFNGDGFNDVMVGGMTGSDSALATPTLAQVILGDSTIHAGSHLGTSGDDILTGDEFNNTLVGGAGNDILDGFFGADTLLGGAGDDILYYDSLDLRMDGGSGLDTLRVSVYDGSVYLDENKISGIEQLDLTGSGDNYVYIEFQNVLSVGDDLFLKVDGDAVDDVWFQDGFTVAAQGTPVSFQEMSLTTDSQGAVQIGSESYVVYTQGPAMLLLDDDLTRHAM